MTQSGAVDYALSITNLADVRAKQDELERRYVAVARDQRRKRLVRPYVDGHIRGCLGRLRAAYLQVYQVDDDFPESDRAWLRDIADSLQRFSTAFPGRSRALNVGIAVGILIPILQFPLITWLIAFTGIGAWIANNLNFCMCHVVAPATLGMVGWIMASMVFGFNAKRKALAAFGIYEKERELLTLVKGEIRRETPVDVLGFFLAAVALAIGASIDRRVGSTTIWGGSRAALFLWIAAVLAAISLVAFVRWLIRRNRTDRLTSGAPASTA